MHDHDRLKDRSGVKSLDERENFIGKYHVLAVSCVIISFFFVVSSSFQFSVFFSLAFMCVIYVSYIVIEDLATAYSSVGQHHQFCATVSILKK